MRYLNSIGMIIGLVCTFSGAAIAQGGRVVAGPAEIPPTSFTAKQYVDSAGCVFVRAGFDGNVVWVPRVSRERKQMCGLAPTFTTAKVTQAPAPKTTVISNRKTAAVTAPQRSALPAETFKAPPGYRSAWTDGRLNSTRGPQTTTGTAKMNLVWSQTVPRRLISR